MVSEQQMNKLLQDILSLQQQVNSLTARLNAAEISPRLEPVGTGVPGIGTDADDGYSVFSMIYYSGQIYICEDSTVGSAVWTQIT